MIVREDFMTLVHAQQFHHWQTFLNNRSELTVKTDSDAAASTSETEEASATDKHDSSS
jgi:hypothetical protein